MTRYLIYVGIGTCSTLYTTLFFFDIFADSSFLIFASKATGAVNLVSDIYTLCIPIAAVSKLQMSMRQKIGIILIFMTGIL